MDDGSPGRRAVLNWCVILVCVLVYLGERFFGGSDQSWHRGLAVVPAWLFFNSPRPPLFDIVPVWLTPLTAVFIHGGFLHLVFNMLWLWGFGGRLEATLGSWRYTALLVACAYGSAIFQAMAHHTTEPVIGASGMIAGVLGAYALLHPKTLILAFIGRIIIPLPAIVILGGWFIIDLLETLDEMQRQATMQIGHPAHLSGFLFGIAFAAVLRPRGMPLFDSDKPWPSWTDYQREMDPALHPRRERFFERITAIINSGLVSFFMALAVTLIIAMAVMALRR